MIKIVLLLALILFTSCLKTDIIYGKGDLVTARYDIANYNGFVNIDLAVPIVIDSGDASVEITIDSDLQKFILVDTTSGAISISLDSTYELRMTELTVAVSIPTLDSIKLNNCDLQTAFSLSDTTSIRLRGNSVFSCGHLNIDTLNLQVEDSASVTLEGKTKYMHLELTSPMDQSLENLTTNELTMYVNRHSDTKMRVWSSIEGELHGAGDFHVLFSTPMKSVKQYGSGQVLFMNTSTVE